MIGAAPNLGGSLLFTPDASNSWLMDAGGAADATSCGAGDGGGNNTCSNGNSGGDGTPSVTPTILNAYAGRGHRSRQAVHYEIDAFLNPNWLGDDGLCGGPSGLSPGCVSLTTCISLFPNGCKPAAEVKVDDLLMSRASDGSLVGERVIGVRWSLQPCAMIQLENGLEILSSLSHEVIRYDSEWPQGKSVQVSELRISDSLLLQDGASIALRGLVRQPDATVVQLSLSGPNHIYLSEGLWSHNKPLVAWPGPP